MKKGTCGCCGKTTYRDIHPEFPECSHGCAEWLVDARHLTTDDWYEMERDNAGW
jgi:hypothetical protein